MIIVYNYKDKKPFTIIGKKKSGSLPDEPDVPDLPDGVLPEVADNEDILVIENVDTTEGTVLMRNPNNISIQYSTNGSEFNDYTSETEVLINPSEKVYFKWSEVISREGGSTVLVNSSVKYKTYGELKKGNESNAYYRMFKNQTNLIDASQLKLSATTLKYKCYNSMFEGCTSLTTAPQLPATTLASYCYGSMFENCTSLTTAPELPATTLEDGCYFSIFKNCTTITKAPELKATTTEANCYYSMFEGCTSLTTAPTLPATTIESQCYISMFKNCTSLTTAPELPATQLNFYCYQSMFNGCTALTTAPELPATQLKYGCYDIMFNGCSKLNYVKHHITDWNESYISNWLKDVASEGTMYCPLNSTIPTGSSGIPEGWTRVNIE